MTNVRYGQGCCDPDVNGCESPSIGEYFIRHVPEGWQILFVDEKIPPVLSTGEVKPFPTREEAEALARTLAKNDLSKALGVSLDEAGKILEANEVLIADIYLRDREIIVSLQGVDIGNIVPGEDGDWYQPLTNGRVRLLRVEIVNNVQCVYFLAPRGAQWRRVR